MLARRGVLHKPWRWGRGVRALWLSPGYFTQLVPPWLSYFRPGFHPDDRDTRALVAAWRTALFDADGALIARAAA